MAKMAQMQRRFIETHFQDIAAANEAEQPMVMAFLFLKFHIYF